MNKDSWEILKLVDICLFFNDGNWIESKDQSESGIRLIQTGNIGNGYYINKEARAKFISEDTFKNLKCTEVFEGDCLVSRLPDPIGRACIVPLIKGRAITSVDCSILRFKPNILASYFVYFSQCKKYTLNIKKSSTGSTRKRISRSNLGNILVPIPPLPIQAKIVKELDTLSDIINKKKEQLAELDKLAQATFYDMFGDPIKNEKEWEMRRLEELGDWASGGTPLRSNLLYFKGSIPWVTSGELNSLFINDTIEHINEEAIRNSNAKLIRKGSLLLGMYDTAALKSSINKREMACNQAIAFSFINTKLCNTIYVYYSIQINKEEYKKEQRGMCQKNLNLSMIKAISILYPPLFLQNQFAEKIEVIEQQKALINQSITDTQLLFDYTMDKYFN
ncbi:restriction endonuclease subunit S [Snodgrassella alvi]|uniref:restriction endonuclease subunit S n=1 Tax=Snodgrassella alvi TaxID=1196083 RepID=UPI000C1EB6B9|nr:restriction endonuclease subunit S [Snodgrassella alvi]PIT31601.1 hypothetical protein BHC50_07525 [Snodgrassella alvi]PIT36808.1 hypothetical protein BHC42_01480 [Snodgrassella alvi]WLT04150.1 restriction endonuclease subunit S [Snodgrassella alvi]